MAIYHFSAKAISRSSGASSVASAAYRSGECLTDKRTGERHDFTRKSDVIESEILLPKDAPAWMADREKLWNFVEESEKRKDAQLARDVNISLHTELTDEQNWKLIKDFIQKEFVDKGMVADVNFHAGHDKSVAQPHAHVMLTMREVNEEGFGKKVREWNSKALLNTWREKWAEYSNLELAKNGHDVQVDHRTLEAQGINLEPQNKIGPTAAREQMAKFAEHQDIARQNGERILKNPEIALKALTQEKSTFTHNDMARFANRHSENKAQFDAVYSTIKSHHELVFLGKDEFRRERFTTQEMLEIESKMIAQSEELSKIKHHAVSDASIRKSLSHKNLSSEQIVALKHLTQEGDAACVSGFAGTGKSYMLGAAREAWEAEGYRVQGMALSGIAAENLQKGSGINSYTVANRMLVWESSHEPLGRQDILVVDEAGMLGSRQTGRIVEEAHKAGAKVVFVGDPEQLQAIQAGAAYRAISERIGFVEMTDVRRQTESWQQEATRDFARAKTKAGLDAYEQHQKIHFFDDKESAIQGMIQQWNGVRTEHPQKTQLMLAYTREDVKNLNHQARSIRLESGELGAETKLKTAKGEKNFSEQDRIYFLRNENKELKVKNGTLGTIEKINGDKVSVRLDANGQEKPRTVEFNLKNYNDIDHGYAATVHKAQGVTVDRAHLLPSEHFDRHSTYVGMSRHRESAEVYVSKAEFKNIDQLKDKLSRERLKDVSADYSSRRGFEKEDSQKLQKSKAKTKTLQQDPMQKKYQEVMKSEIRAYEKKQGVSVSLEPKEGDKGTYVGLQEIAGRNYGVIRLESANPEDPKKCLLVPSEKMGSHRKSQEVMIEKQTKGKDLGKLKVVEQPKKEAPEKSQTLSKSVSQEIQPQSRSRGGRSR